VKAVGGKGKKGIKQIEKQQMLKEKAKKEKPKKTVKKEAVKPKPLTHLESGLLTSAKQAVAEMKCITPYELASKINVKLSIAKQILRSLASASVIKLVSKSHRTSIYTPVTP